MQVHHLWRYWECDFCFESLVCFPVIPGSTGDIKIGDEIYPSLFPRLLVATATLAEIIEAAFTKCLGRSAAEFMPRVRIRAGDGQPNWDVTIGTIALPILSAFNEAWHRLQVAYELDESSHRLLMSL